jgi:hypothetical protein
MLSIHLPSKESEHLRLSDFVLKMLLDIRKENPNVKMVMGINSNHFMEESSLYLYPE